MHTYALKKVSIILNKSKKFGVSQIWKVNLTQNDYAEVNQENPNLLKCERF